MRDGETGLIVPRGDDEGMAVAALRLLADAALAERLAACALEECRHKYAPEAVVREWRSMYEGLVAYSDGPAAELAPRPGSLR